MLHVLADMRNLPPLDTLNPSFLEVPKFFFHSINNVFVLLDSIDIFVFLTDVCDKLWKLVLQQTNAPLNAKNNSGETPLHVAALRYLFFFIQLSHYLIHSFLQSNRNNIWGVQELLKHKSVQVNELNQRGETALHYASRKGYTQMVELLSKLGADIQITGIFGIDEASSS